MFPPIVSAVMPEQVALGSKESRLNKPWKALDVEVCAK